jgi:hypothetical protein
MEEESQILQEQTKKGLECAYIKTIKAECRQNQGLIATYQDNIGLINWG